MQSGNAVKQWITIRLGKTKPELLWRRHTFAVCIILAMLAITYRANDTIVRYQTQAAELVSISNAQSARSQLIVLRAAEYANSKHASFKHLKEAIDPFSDMHRELVSGTLWSDALQAHFFGGARSVHVDLLEFASIARALESAEPADRAAGASTLAEFYESAGILPAIVRAGQLFSEQANTESAQLRGMQRAIIVICAAILLVEAVLIFLPAQVVVNNALKELRKKTEVLAQTAHQHRQMNDRLNYIINHDMLTGLPNRAYLINRLAAVLSDEQAGELVVLFLGLDNFKAVNDAAGHTAGDTILCNVADALTQCINEDDLVARVGGDEFLLISFEPAQQVLARVQNATAQPIIVNGRKFQIGASIGCIVPENKDTDPYRTIADAGIALQAAKAAGGQRAVTYSDSLRDAIQSMQELQTELRHAIDTGEIEPWFQPQFCLADGKIHGAEVLARWRHPKRGMLSPDQFLPAAERAGIIIDLDHAIWSSAMLLARDWRQSGLWRPRLSLNASPDTLSDPNMIERLLLELQRFQMDVDQVVVEVLETTLINGADDMAAINIDSLAECGIALDLDDFGTGYASLSKLTQLPLTGIKLDRSLIMHLPDAAADSVVRAILALASELGLTVTAEGIEEDSQALHLNRSGCALGQGFGFARPMPAADFVAWLGLNRDKIPSKDLSKAQLRLRA